jgi:hypothetical protein
MIMKTHTQTWQQTRPPEWLKENPGHTWRCEIYTYEGQQYHGLGETEAEAMQKACALYLLVTEVCLQTKKNNP